MPNLALDAQLIQAQLTPAIKDLLHIHCLNQVDSTNRWVLQAGECASVCIAEQQTAGRGRRGRNWHSPLGANIYLSLRWCFPHVPAHLSLLSLVTGLAVAEALQRIGIQGHGVKWPNDLYYHNKKLGGILLESVGSLTQVVIGIGLNVNMLPTQGETIDQPWTSLQQIQGRVIERNALIAQILNLLVVDLQAFLQWDMAQFQRHWQQWDVLNKQQVRVLSGDESIEGIAQGIDSQGQLCLRLADGSLRTFSSADISVRM